MTFGVYRDPEGTQLIEQYDFTIQYNKEIAFALAVHGFNISGPSGNQSVFSKTKETITQGIFFTSNSLEFVLIFRGEESCSVFAAFDRKFSSFAF